MSALIPRSRSDSTAISTRASSACSTLLRIPSISTDPAYAADCRRAAEWLVADLNSIGFDASVRDTPGHPMVVAHHDGPRRTARMCCSTAITTCSRSIRSICGIDDPFEPAVKEIEPGRKVITGRGSSDDKGQLMLFVEALPRLEGRCMASCPAGSRSCSRARRNPARHR